MSDELFHALQPNEAWYAEVILPLALPKTYTYLVPTHLYKEIQVGVRVEVQLGKNKLYSGLVAQLHKDAPKDYNPKPLLSVIDTHPILYAQQLQLWRWLADYYCCTMGEVMTAALPYGFKLNSETRLVLSPLFEGNYEGLSDKEFLIAEALSIQQEIGIEDVQAILQQKTVYPLIQSLLDKQVILLKEELKEKYKPKTVACVKLHETLAGENPDFSEAFSKVQKSDKQTAALLAFIQLSKKNAVVKVQEVYDLAKIDAAVLKSLEKKEIFTLYKVEISRLGDYSGEINDLQILSEQQIKAIDEVKKCFLEKNVVLLHGVTGSGKTRVYIEIIEEAIKNGEQVLYLLPEIALTTQVINRLQKLFGDNIMVYHSRLNNNERVELWNSMFNGKSVLLGARSSLFLPFKNLKWVIIDEEHDPSYKQQEPNPHYNARDAAIYLAQLFGAKVLLGSATPSIESYFNAKTNKYGLVEMHDRFGGIEMPETVIANLKEEAKDRKAQAHFSNLLLEEIKETLARGEQIILFQNRRGYAPSLRCTVCGWHSECKNCDVSLTYHKAAHNLRCHYCGYDSPVFKECPACASKQLTLKGFGTEKIEDELKIYFPDARIGRMDLDTVRTKNAHAQIITEFEEKRIEILVGTQMVTKGLDFENVGLVGVINADSLLQFPDFRASERAYQLILQVSGRAGRKNKRGKVVIQTGNPSHTIIREAYAGNYLDFYQREIRERKDFHYPPFLRLIRITLKHKKPEAVNTASAFLSKILKEKFGNRVIGPAPPYIPRIRNLYLTDFLLKIEREAKMMLLVKDTIKEAAQLVRAEQGLSGLRVDIDVDPY